MKIRISGVEPVIENVPEVIEEPIMNEEITEDTSEIEESEPDLEDQEEDIEEESDADFQYNNSGIYFRNGIEIEFDTNYDDISVKVIKFPNDITFTFQCDEFGNLVEWKKEHSNDFEE